MPEETLICEDCLEEIPPSENNWSSDAKHPLCMDCFFREYAAPAMSDLDAEVERRR